jgi:hypothetical protein
VYSVLVRKPEGTKHLQTPRHRWEDNIKVNFHEVGLRVTGWTDLAQDRDRWRPSVNGIRILWVPQNSGKFLTS